MDLFAWFAVMIAAAVELPLSSSFFLDQYPLYASNHNTATTHSSYTHSHSNHNCLAYSSYNVLRQLGEANACLSANSVWHYLDNLQVRSPYCRKEIQKYLAAKYDRSSHFHDKCTCHPRTTLENHEIYRIRNGSIFDCRDHLNAGAYKTIDVNLFSNIQRHGCRNHVYLWPILENVANYCSHTTHSQTGSHCIDCQQDLIVRASLAYPDTQSDPCVCSKPFVAPTKTTSPSPPTTRIATTKTTQTTRAPTVHVASVTTASYIRPRHFVCNEISVVEYIAMAQHITHPKASVCDRNAAGSDEAFVLSSCNMTSQMTWRRGKSVMTDCKSNTHSIPGFTPISTFARDIYSTLGSQPGVFLECLNNGGFKMAIQKCNSSPEIVHIEAGGVFNNNPNNYYVIV